MENGHREHDAHRHQNLTHSNHDITAEPLGVHFEQHCHGSIVEGKIAEKGGQTVENCAWDGCALFKLIKNILLVNFTRSYPE